MSNQYPLVSVNGILGASVSPFDRGFAYGDGIFETCRVEQGSTPLWELHLSRLKRGCQQLNIPLDVEMLERFRIELLREASRSGISDGVLKIIVTRGEGGRGYAPPEQMVPTYCFLLYPPVVMAGGDGIRIRICNQRLSQNANLAGLKHLNRLEHILARSEWQSEFDEGLLLDNSGSIIEATASNLFIVREKCLVTPDLSFSGVDGILRQLIIERLAPSLGMRVVVESVQLAELLAADEIFLCNSVRGIVPVMQVVAATTKDYLPGHYTQILRAEFARFIENQGRGISE